MAHVGGVRLKKKFGQNFLRDDRITQSIVSAVQLDDQTNVLEIGCGDGFLTRSILQFPVRCLWAFEIDPEWSTHIRTTITDERLTLFSQDFLQFDCALLKEQAPWTMLSNLPYNITFPILHRLQEYRSLFKEGVLMVQEEVAQKITKKRGKGFGQQSLFFQYYFDWKLLDKVHPSSFHPAPRVFSRLLYFKPRADVVPIPDEKRFWEFVSVAFKSPRRTLRNNLIATIYPIDRIDPEILILRAQQLSMAQFLELWELLG